MSKVRIVDRGFNKRMKTIREATQGRGLSVGVHEAEGSKAYEDGDMALVDVAVIHEFGTDDIPQRSFIGGWVDENAAANDKILSNAAKQIVSGKAPIDQALNQAGAVMRGDVQARIRAGIAPANAEATIEAKGSSTPLIRSGQLWQAITWMVRK